MTETNLVDDLNRETIGEIAADTPTQVGPTPSAQRPTQMSQQRALGFVTLNRLARICRKQPTNYVVEGLLPADDVHVAVGDSGLGKTPWAYQLGFCVATGKPFLGHPVKQGRVLYFDFENGREEILELGRTLKKHLALQSLPRDFLVSRDEGDISLSLESAVISNEPVLVIIDTLRAFRPTAEGKNEDMASLLKECRGIARKYRCAILLLHHVKKPGLIVPSLEDTLTLTWLLQASGARALVNQTNTRIALDAPRSMNDAALAMKAFVKMRGESGPLYLARVLDEDGEPIGYRRIVGCELLSNPDQVAAFRKLPERFTFKEAMATYGKTDNPTTQWLKKCEAAGLILRPRRGAYERVVA